MLLRPVDASGDILPVLSSRALLSGPEAVARLAEYRLSLLIGEWWENAGTGFSILEVMRSARLPGETDAEARARVKTALSSLGCCSVDAMEAECQEAEIKGFETYLRQVISYAGKKQAGRSRRKKAGYNKKLLCFMRLFPC